MIYDFLNDALVIYRVLFTRFYTKFKKPNARYITEFIKKNPDRCSILWVKNDKIIWQLNPDKLMPLASTVKIIVAIEYAQQVAAGKINPGEQIDTTELAKYYIPNTDGNAHPGWLASVKTKGLIIRGKISVEEVARGMIMYSSNANTEFLMDKLGFDSINANLLKLGLTQHQKLYPRVAALFISRNKTKKELKQMSLDAYINESFKFHEQLKSGSPALNKTMFYIPFYAQKIYSDRSPCATTKEYVSIMKKINDRNYFDEKTQYHLDGLMEWLFDNPKNKERFIHIGKKGGSTSFVLTTALYAADKNGDKSELAYFLNDLAPWKTIFLKACMNGFLVKTLTDINSFSTHSA